MSEWLTTGQIIDRLIVGGVAQKMLSGTETNHYITKIDSGIIGYCNEDGSCVRDIGSLNSFFLTGEWRILPNYVTFEEAIQALREDKEVNFTAKNNYTYRILPKQNFNALKNDGIVWENLLTGKWTIKD